MDENIWGSREKKRNIPFDAEALSRNPFLQFDVAVCAIYGGTEGEIRGACKYIDKLVSDVLTNQPVIKHVERLREEDTEIGDLIYHGRTDRDIINSVIENGFERTYSANPKPEVSQQMAYLLHNPGLFGQVLTKRLIPNI